jgi:hypothetical protein
MLATIRITVISAVLSALVVSTFWAAEPPMPASAPSKDFLDRVSEPLFNLQTGAASSAVRSAGQKADRIKQASSGCRDAAWPYVPDECISKATAEAPRIVRTVTLETRSGNNTSVLVRLPQTVLAAR